VRYRIIEQNTYAVVKRVIPEGKTMCGWLTLRRGALYRFAEENGMTKIAWATTGTTSSRPCS